MPLASSQGDHPEQALPLDPGDTCVLCSGLSARSGQADACGRHGYDTGSGEQSLSGCVGLGLCLRVERHRGRPKPTRRLAPAGSVYFLELTGADDAIGRFVDAVWLQAISDDEQDQRDGFGLALLGAWDGVPKPLLYRTGEAS